MESTDHNINTLTSQVIGAAIEVHRHLGPGFLESVYEAALCLELAERAVQFSSQHPISVEYKGQLVGESRLDLLVGGRLIVELKAVDQIHNIHVVQVISYLKATNLSYGLLINFNTKILKDGIRRIVFD
jgi:GxxExxY protein